MAKLISCTCSTVAAAIAGFDAPVDPSSITYAYHWLVVPVVEGLDSGVVYAVPRAGDALVDLKFSPPLSPGKDYRLYTEATVGGIALAPGDEQFVFTAPGASLDIQPQYKVLENLSWAVAEEMAQLVGRPETQTTEEFPEGADVLAVETTLGFPSAGGIWVDGKKYTYQQRQGSTFLGVAASFPQDGFPVPARSWVVLDLATVAT